MPILMSESASIDVLRDVVTAIVVRRERAGRKVERTAGPSASRSLDIAGPHRVFSAGLDDAGGRGMLQRAQAIGSRVFVLEGDRPVAMAQLSGREDRFSNVTFGILGESMLRAIDVAETLPEVADHDVELRVVELPGIHVIALWLVTAAITILIPLDPAPPPLQANRPSTADEFEDAVTRIVETRRRGGAP